MALTDLSPGDEIKKVASIPPGPLFPILGTVLIVLTLLAFIFGYDNLPEQHRGWTALCGVCVIFLGMLMAVIGLILALKHAPTASNLSMDTHDAQIGAHKDNGGVLPRTEEELIGFANEAAPPVSAGNWLSTGASSTDNCRVHYGWNDQTYSERCRDSAAIEDTSWIFSVCGFDPRYFAERLTTLEGCSFTKLVNMPADKLRVMAGSSFPHFFKYSEFYNARVDVDSQCAARVLLVKNFSEREVTDKDDGRETLTKWLQRNRQFIEMFLILNGRMPCYLANCSLLQRSETNVRLLVDHTVFQRHNELVMLHYLNGGDTLVEVHEAHKEGEDPQSQIAVEILAFRDHFWSKQTLSNVYRDVRKYLP